MLFSLFNNILILQDEINTKLTVDCANGVGAPKLKKLCDKIGFSDVVVVNDGSSNEGKLNENCGADYVKIQQNAPRGNCLFVCDP